MTKAGSPRSATLPRTAIQLALEDHAVRADLDRHAVSRLCLLLTDRPRAVREDLAKESVQEASRRALALEERFVSSQAPAKAWLHGILERVLHEQCRTLRKQPAQPCADPAGWEDLEVRLAAPDHWPALTRLLSHLPDEHRQMVTMHHLDGLSHEVIAATFGISVGYSRVRLARAMAELKRIAAREDVL